MSSFESVDTEAHPLQPHAFISFFTFQTWSQNRTNQKNCHASSSPLCLLFPGTGVDLLCSRTALSIKICNFIICITKLFSLLYSTHASCVCFYGASVFRNNPAFKALRCYCGCYDLCRWEVCMYSADELAWVNCRHDHTMNWTLLLASDVIAC